MKQKENYLTKVWENRCKIEKDRNTFYKILNIIAFLIILLYSLFILTKLLIPITIGFLSWILTLIQDYFMVDKEFKFFATTIIIIMLFKIITAFIWLLTILMNALKKINKKYEYLNKKYYCANCGEQEVKNKGDWCDDCNLPERSWIK